MLCLAGLMSKHQDWCLWPAVVPDAQHLLQNAETEQAVMKSQQQCLNDLINDTPNRRVIIQPHQNYLECESYRKPVVPPSVSSAELWCSERRRWCRHTAAEQPRWSVWCLQLSTSSDADGNWNYWEIQKLILLGLLNTFMWFSRPLPQSKSLDSRDSRGERESEWLFPSVWPSSFDGWDGLLQTPAALSAT